VKESRFPSEVLLKEIALVVRLSCVMNIGGPLAKDIVLIRQFIPKTLQDMVSGTARTRWALEPSNGVPGGSTSKDK